MMTFLLQQHAGRLGSEDRWNRIGEVARLSNILPLLKEAMEDPSRSLRLVYPKNEKIDVRFTLKFTALETWKLELDNGSPTIPYGEGSTPAKAILHLMSRLKLDLFSQELHVLLVPLARHLGIVIPMELARDIEAKARLQMQMDVLDESIGTHIHTLIVRQRRAPKSAASR